MNVHAIWLRTENGHTVVLAEIQGQFVEMIREYSGCPFSHIIEESGMIRAVKIHNGQPVYDACVSEIYQ